MGRQRLSPQPSIFIPLLALSLVAGLLLVFLIPWVPCPRCEGEGTVLWLGDPEYLSRAEVERRISVPKFEIVVDCDGCRRHGRVSLLRRWRGVPAVSTTLVY